MPVEPRAGSRGEPIHAQRADIVDRNGAVLATNIVTASLYAQPAEMIDPRAAPPTALARIFPDLDAGRALRPASPTGASSSGSSASISPEQRQRVHDLGEPGLLFGPRETRLYPNGAVAAHVLGGASFGREGVHAAEVIGTAGVERVFDARLRDPARVAEPLRLSIDLEVQTALEEVLAAGHGRDARQGRRRHPDGGRHRADPRAREPARLRPEPAPAAADQRRPGRQPALQPRGAGALRARLDLQAVHRRRWRSTRAWSSPQTLVDTKGADALGPLHHPRLPRLRRRG